MPLFLLKISLKYKDELLNSYLIRDKGKGLLEIKYHINRSKSLRLFSNMASKLIIIRWIRQFSTNIIIKIMSF